MEANDELEKTEVTVAPGRSMREPVKIHKVLVKSQSGAPEERVIDVEHRAVLPGQKIKVFTKDVPALIAMGTILDPATSQIAPNAIPTSGPALSH